MYIEKTNVDKTDDVHKALPWTPNHSRDLEVVCTCPVYIYISIYLQNDEQPSDCRITFHMILQLLLIKTDNIS